MAKRANKTVELPDAPLPQGPAVVDHMLDVYRTDWVFSRLLDVDYNPETNTPPLDEDERVISTTKEVEDITYDEYNERVWTKRTIHLLRTVQRKKVRRLCYVDFLRDAPTTKVRRLDGLEIKVEDTVQLWAPSQRSTRRLAVVKAFRIDPELELLRFINEHGQAVNLSLVAAVEDVTRRP